MVDCNLVVDMRVGLNLTCMHTLKNSRREKTKESSSAVFVARSVEINTKLSLMWKISTFQEVSSMIVTNATKNLTPRRSGPIIAHVCTPTSRQSEKLHEKNMARFLLWEYRNLTLPIVASK